MKWYAKESSAGQGIIADEATGRTVAVSYDVKDMHLLASAPKLRDALRDIIASAQKSGVAIIDLSAGREALRDAEES